jgi:hypothetical protein
MSAPFSLIVTDTSPLITLVLAEALDVLLHPGLPVTPRHANDGADSCIGGDCCPRRSTSQRTSTKRSKNML